MFFYIAIFLFIISSIFIIVGYNYNKSLFIYTGAIIGLYLSISVVTSGINWIM